MTSIWWLPLALPRLLGMVEVEVESVARQENGRLLLRGVVYVSDSVRVAVPSAEMPAVHQYLWERFCVGFSEASLVQVDTLVLEQLLVEDGALAAGPTDPVSVVRQLRETMVEYGLWLPPLELRELEVRGSAGESLLTAQDVGLRDWQMTVRLDDICLPEELVIRATLNPEMPWMVQVVAEESGLGLDLSLDAAGDGYDLRFELHRADERIEGLASFVEGQWQPVRAHLVSERISIDSQWLSWVDGLDWESATLSELELRWEKGSYVGAFLLNAAMAAGQSSIPLHGDVSFSGDLQTLQLDTFQLDASWVQLALSQPLGIRLKDGSALQRAELRAKLDLSKQAFVAAAGKVEARLSVVPSLLAGPNLSFELSGTDLVYDGYQLSQVNLSGDLEGAALSIEQMRIQPLAADDGVVELSGRADLSARELDFDYKGSVAPDWVNAFVDEVMLSGVLKASGRITGDFQVPTIEGVLEVITVEYPGVMPVSVSGTYKGEGLERWTVAATASSAGAVIDTSFVAQLEAGSVSVDLNRFVWTDPVRPTLELQSPARVSYQFSEPVDFPESRVVVGPFHLSGPELDVQGQWSSLAGLELQLRNVTLQRLGRWVNRELPSLSIESVALSLSELRPRVLGSVDVHLESRSVGEGATLRVDASAQFTSDGIVADMVQLKFASAPLLEGSITAPIVFQIPVEGQTFWHLLEAGNLAAELSGSVSPAFSDWLLRTTGVAVSEADLNLNVQGTMEQPIGMLELQVAALKTPVAGGASIERIEILAKAEPNRIQLEHFKFRINQSEVIGALSLPVQGLRGALTGELDQLQAWLANGSGRLELVDWHAENWVEYLPTIMRRSGRLSGHLELKPDWGFSGRLSFQEFALRPTNSLPSIDLISGQVALADRKFSVQAASVQVGGSPVAFEGWLDAGDFEHPLWEFAISGSNVPLVRTTDMILRSDLDVKASHTSQMEEPLVHGALNLRSSTMLVEFDPLAPSVEGGRLSRPPFFSINEPTIADWRFDLKIEGDSFMRVRSPYFKTQLTASFELGGTFVEPLLIGSVRTVDGELRFPGAKMRIASGEAYIEPGRPNAVQLNFNGMAQKASHIITMDVTQTLDDPHIQFQSTPALSNASIVRLLATGSTTGGGVGTVGLYLGQGLLGAGGMDEQFSDRLTLDVGEETSRSGRNTVGVRYDLSEDFFLEGGYDVYDAYNLDLIWSLFKR